jgi:glycosyltransferase involved in cell wall biosynthesis
VGGGPVSSLPANCLALGKLTDLRLMAAAYSAADVFVSTTLQDTVPATVVESQLCGTPVVGFRLSGQQEMVSEGAAGHLDDSIGVDGLLAGIRWFETQGPERTRIADQARKRWDQSTVLNQWMHFYGELK